MATAAVNSSLESTQIQHESQAAKPVYPAWTAWERALFRVSLLFILQIVLPFRAQFWHRLISSLFARLLWYSEHWRRAGYITPSSESGRWGIGSSQIGVLCF